MDPKFSKNDKVNGSIFEDQNAIIKEVMVPISLHSPHKNLVVPKGKKKR